QVSGSQMGRNGMAGVGNVAEVGLMVFVQGSWNADDDSVHLGELGVIGGGGKSLLSRCANFFGRDAENIRAAGVQRVNFMLIDIEARDSKLLLGVQQSE